MKAKHPSGGGLAESPMHRGTLHQPRPRAQRPRPAEPRRAVPYAPAPSRSAVTPGGGTGAAASLSGGVSPAAPSPPFPAAAAERTRPGVAISARCPCLGPRAGRCGGRGRGAAAERGPCARGCHPPPCLSPRRGRAGQLHQHLGDFSTVGQEAAAPWRFQHRAAAQRCPARGVFGLLTQRGSA